MTFRRFALIASVAGLLLSAAAVAHAYGAGYCLMAGCRCHQYVGGSGTQDPCMTCGHKRVQHS